MFGGDLSVLHSPYQGLPELEFPFQNKVIGAPTVDAFAWAQRDFSSTVFAGQAVGVKEVDHGIWLVSFMDYDLGYIDLEEKTLQPLQNPFGPKV
jgi:hypothetical protein